MFMFAYFFTGMLLKRITGWSISCRFFDRSHDIIRKHEGMRAGWVIHRGKL